MFSVARRSFVDHFCEQRLRGSFPLHLRSHVLLTLALLVLAASGATAATVPDAAGGDRFVPITPCRLLDTRTMPPADSSEESLRVIDIASTRCARIVPANATGYAIRRSSYNRAESAAPAAAAQPQPQTRHNANAPLNVSVAASEHVVVDLEGYYVAPGTPVDPATVSTGSPAAVIGAQSVSAAPPPATGIPFAKHADVVTSGTAGDIWLDASRTGYTGTGILGAATAGTPWVIFKSGDTGLGAGFAVYNSSDAELFRVGSNTVGFVRAISSNAFSGRTDYRESSTIQTNVLHNVIITNPHDQNGGAASNVTFFNAQSNDEAGSPGTTKFHAFTMGYYDQYHINFDSQVQYHWPQFKHIYHYRAYSGFESKATYWVRTGTNVDSQNGTRADMWVSGNVGIGTLDNNGTVTQPGNKLYVRDVASQATLPSVDATVTTVVESSADASAASLAIIGGRKLDSQNRPGFARLYLGNYDEWDSTRIEGGAGKFTIFVRNAGAPAAPAITVLPNGNVGVGQPNPTAKLDVNGSVNVTGIIHAQYQDVAEWVPSGERLTPGTVVVIDGHGSNRVTPSTHAYDTAIAGVVSAMPGILLGEEALTKSQIATTGRVRVHVDASKGSIAAGDLLVTSGRPGTAMKSEPIDVGGVKIHRPGTLIGKALEPLPSGEGDILVLLSLQ
jgi:hypothetical protein